MYSQAVIRGLENRCGGPGPSASGVRMQRYLAGCHPLSGEYIGPPTRVIGCPTAPLVAPVAWQLGRPGQVRALVERPATPVAILTQAPAGPLDRQDAESFPQVGDDPEEGAFDPLFEGIEGADF